MVPLPKTTECNAMRRSQVIFSAVLAVLLTTIDLVRSQVPLAPAPAAPRSAVSPGGAGPVGSGSPTYQGPVGGGSPPLLPPSSTGGNPAPEPPPSSAPTPEPPRPSFPRPMRPGPPVTRSGVIIPPAAPYGGPRPAPVGPFPGSPSPNNPNAPGAGGKTTTPYYFPFPTDRWENWWYLNHDRFLDLTRSFAARAETAEASGDEFLGFSPPTSGAHPVYLDRSSVHKELLPILIEHLSDGNAVVRGEAALALGKVGSSEALAKLKGATRDTNRFVRQMALLGLGLTNDPDAVKPLCAFLLDGGEQDGDRAFAALGLAVLARAESVPALVTILHRSGVDRGLEASALYALGFSGSEDAAIVLREYVDELSRAGDLRGVATLALGKFKDVTHIPRLLQLLDDEEVHVRRSAACALGLQSFESRFWSRRDTLLERLRIADERNSLTPEARRQLQEHVAEVERRASLDSRDLYETEKRVVAALAKAMDSDRDRMVRHFAVMALARIGSPEARIELAKEYRKASHHDASRGFLALALGVARSKESGSTLRKMLDQKSLDPSSRGAIMTALGLLDDEAVGDDLVTFALQESDPEVRGHAIVAVGLMNFRPAREQFRKALQNDAQEFLRPTFGLALALMGDWQSIATLEDLAVGESTSTTTRIEAAQALANVHDTEAIEILKRVLAPAAKSTDVVRATALHSLGEIAEKTPLPGLEPLARDWNYLLPFPVINEAVLR